MAGQEAVLNAPAQSADRDASAAWHAECGALAHRAERDVPTQYRPREAWRLQSVRAHDVDEHARGLGGWQQRYDQLTPGSFVGWLDELSTGAAQVFRERTSQALRQRCEVWPDAVWCGLTLAHDGSRIDGREVAEHGVMVCGRAARFELVSPVGHDVLGVVVGREALLRHADAVGMALAWPLVDRAPWLQVTPARRALAMAQLRAVLALAAADAAPSVTRGALNDTLLDVVAGLLEAPHEPRQARCNATARRRLVQQVHAWALDDPAAVFGVGELCARLHVSRRTLQYAFAAETSMSPLAYLRSIRLNGVRRRLRGFDGPVCSVREAAAAWGFWNLSQFASDYRRQFGERPSDTLQRAVGSGDATVGAASQPTGSWRK